MKWLTGTLVLILFTLGLGFFGGVLATRDLSNRDIMIKVLPIVRGLRDITDLLYFPYFFQKSKLPHYELEIKPEDLEFLNSNLPAAYSDDVHLTDEYKKYVPAVFIAGNQEYEVEVRYRGDTSAHWSAPKKSWLIKFQNKNLFEGIKRIHLILPFDRGYVMEQLNNYRARKLGLIAPQSRFATLTVNGALQGAYFETEGWDEELIAKNQRPDQANLYGLISEEWVLDRVYDQLNQVGFWQKYAQEELLPDDFSQLQMLLDLFDEPSDEKFFAQIPDLLDMEKFYKWQIHSLLVNSKHQTIEDLRFYFNNASGKFELIPWDIEQKPLAPSIDENYNFIVERMLKNPQFVEERNKILWDYVKDEQNLEDDLRFYDEAYELFKTAYYQDPLKVKSNLQFDLEVKQRRKMYEDNYHYIQKAIKNSRVFVNIKTGLSQANTALLEIETGNFGAVCFKGLELESNSSLSSGFQVYYDRNKNQSLDKGDDLIGQAEYDSQSGKYSLSGFEFMLYSQRVIEPERYEIEIKPSRYDFLMVSSGQTALEPKKVKLSLTNALTGKKTKTDIRYLDQESFGYFGQISQNLKNFQEHYPFFKQNSDVLYQIDLGPGSYQINETVIIPKGFLLNIKPGTVLRFAPEASLVSYSPVQARGTEENPIKILGQDASSFWGVFAVLGPHEQSSIFDYCFFEKGSQAYINGVFYSGQLAVHYADALIENCRFEKAGGDDGLNVKKARVEIKNNYISQNKFDGVDLDWTSGLVSNNYFSDNGSDINGDALDISGTENLAIFNNILKGSPDKCLSIGEEAKKSTIIFNNLASECNIGIAVKDNSVVSLFNNVIVNNQTGIAVYEKKQVFGGAWVRVLNSIVWANAKSIELDQKSGIDISFSDIQGGYQGQSNLDQEPFFKNIEQGDYTLLEGGANLLLENGGNLEQLNAVLKQKQVQAPIGLIIPLAAYD